MRRYVIIGSGVAGISAAEAIRNQDQAGELLTITDEPHHFYSRPGLAYLLSGEIPEHFLFRYSEDDYRQINLKRRTGHVDRVDPEAHRIYLADKSVLVYDRLLIANGATAVRTPVPGADLEGVVKLDNLDDVLHIKQLARKTRSAVVVGGGITALELVEGLIKNGVRPHYFLRGDRYWSNVLDETESRIVEHRLKEDGVEIHFNTELAEIIGQKGRVTGVRTKDNQVIRCEMVCIAIGIQPRKELAVASGLKVDRSILVNETLQTSAPDVYAAGDVAQVFDPYTGKYLLDSLWGPARLMGRAAGINMSGTTAPYLKKMSFNVTRLAGITTTIIGMVGGGKDADMVGIARGDSEIWRQQPDAFSVQDLCDVNRVRLLVGEGSLQGALIMGDQVLSSPLQTLILNQVDITPIREKLMQPAAPLGDLITNLWEKWEHEHAAQQS